ncbi:MAG: N-acetylmuramoyl-L-alanine amidase, partial [Armatimonadota bacterium]
IIIDLPNAHQAGYRARFSSSGHLLLDINDSFESPDVAGKRIAIDPGHGGSDTGAVGPTGLTEKEVNLTISSLLRERLETAGAEVVMTRYTDTAVAPGSDKSGELEARVQATKAAGADVFVSVHNNAVGGGDPTGASGTETYYWTPMSHLLAMKLQNGLVSALGTRDRFVSWQRFYVLRDTDCPRALVECAFMSNPEEERKMRDRAFLASAAHGLFQGLQSYFREAVQPPGLPGPMPLQAFPSPLTGTFPPHQWLRTGS